MWKDTVAGKKNLQLKGNTIPRGLVPLERIFNKYDMASKPMAPEKDEQVEDYNIGTEEEPQRITLSKPIPLQYKHRYLNLFRTYEDVFSCSYDDL